MGSKKKRSKKEKKEKKKKIPPMEYDLVPKVNKVDPRQPTEASANGFGWFGERRLITKDVAEEFVKLWPEDSFAKLSDKAIVHVAVIFMEAGELLPPVVKSRLEKMKPSERTIGMQKRYTLIPWITAQANIGPVVERFKEKTGKDMADYFIPAYEAIDEIAEEAEGEETGEDDNDEEDGADETGTGKPKATGTVPPVQQKYVERGFEGTFLGSSRTGGELGSRI